MTAPTAETTFVALWGPDHLDPAEIEVAGVDPLFAVAMSRGGPKSRPVTDPNEDSVAIVGRGDRIVLAVADGHFGREASVAAVGHLLAELDPPPWTLDADAAHRLTEGVARATHLAVEEGVHPRSRTTLSVALVSGRELWWTSTGDSPLYVVDADGARCLNDPNNAYLGGPVSPAELRGSATVGREMLESGTWVCATSDGFSDFARPSPPEALDAVLRADAAPADAARRLVQGALDGGAGDNVAVAVARVG